MVKLIKFVIISVFQLVFVNCDRPQNEIIQQKHTETISAYGENID
jgi:hypothetical protein